MADSSVTPFKISIPDADLDLLHRKLELTRLPPPVFNWTEENKLSPAVLRSTLDFWLQKYSWRAEEAKINETLPQYSTKIAIEAGDGVDEGNVGVQLDVHFVHSRAATATGGATDRSTATPLLFLHGWPGSFLEISKGLGPLNAAGFDVVAPSLPGYGFSSYPPYEGFDYRGHARIFDALMRRLGYDEYVVQGGDWGSSIARTIGVLYSERVKYVHVNMFSTGFSIPASPSSEILSSMTPHELAVFDRHQNYFVKNNAAYASLQAQRPITLGVAMHDSPMGLLAYIADKLITWSDAYPWSPTELITWTLMHYFAGPSTGFVMYHENSPGPLTREGSGIDGYMKTPLGLSSFRKEIVMKPRAVVEKVANLIYYKEHDVGGHFAMWEVPDLLVADVIESVKLAKKQMKK